MSEMTSEISGFMSAKDAAELKGRYQRDAAALALGQQWFFIEFPSVNDAIVWLNTPGIQAAGEVCATVRNNGEVGMLVLFPSINPPPVKRWHFQNFPSTNAAATFLNGGSPKLAGEVSATIRNDGTVGLIYLE